MCGGRGTETASSCLVSSSLCLQGKVVGGGGEREYSTSNLEQEADFCTRGFSTWLGSEILQVSLILVMLGFVLNYLFLMLLVSGNQQKQGRA